MFFCQHIECPSLVLQSAVIAAVRLENCLLGNVQQAHNFAWNALIEYSHTVLCGNA